jgi:hypothetical protein
MMGMIAAAGLIYVDDPQKGITAVFDQSGERVASIRTGVMDPYAFQIAGVRADSSVVFLSRETRRPPAARGSETFMSNALVIISSAHAVAPDTLLMPPGTAMVNIGGAESEVPFTQMAAFAAGGRHVYYGRPATYQIDLFDASGKLAKRIRRSWTPPPVTTADQEFWKSHLLNPENYEGGAASPAIARMRQVVEGIEFPESHPAFAELRVDPAGNLWVRRNPMDALRGPFRPWERPKDPIPNDWDTFDTRGVWLGSIALPANLAVSEIGKAFVTGVERDEDDVEYVVVFQLIKSPTR